MKTSKQGEEAQRPYGWSKVTGLPVTLSAACRTAAPPFLGNIWEKKRSGPTSHPQDQNLHFNKIPRCNSFNIDKQGQKAQGQLVDCTLQSPGDIWKVLMPVSRSPRRVWCRLQLWLWGFYSQEVLEHTKVWGSHVWSRTPGPAQALSICENP